MSNEIAHGSDDTDVLDAYVYRFADKFILNFSVGDNAYEAIGTWNDARAAECNIPMTAVGDVHFADFPASARDTYFVLIKLRTGANPAANDIRSGQGVIYWDGKKEVTILTEIESWEKNG